MNCLRENCDPQTIYARGKKVWGVDDAVGRRAALRVRVAVRPPVEPRDGVTVPEAPRGGEGLGNAVPQLRPLAREDPGVEVGAVAQLGRVVVDDEPHRRGSHRDVEDELAARVGVCSVEQSVAVVVERDHDGPLAAANDHMRPAPLDEELRVRERGGRLAARAVLVEAVVGPVHVRGIGGLAGVGVVAVAALDGVAVAVRVERGGGAEARPPEGGELARRPGLDGGRTGEGFALAGGDAALGRHHVVVVDLGASTEEENEGNARDTGHDRLLCGGIDSDILVSLSIPHQECCHKLLTSLLYFASSKRYFSF